ncbi:tRNA-dihydrouridine synthase family protein [Deinococcus sp. KNUC1210]|uniref:tRNA dihydrouridine synthase n=1 Tax=Deinococcus sp. KNUC1210 TaxID=2917691 RepID=UPI001EF08BED|nr:tRNA-dihydrouridine synthase family protein [Deinococcus sp. KNUC1210]ULH16810.1 tRNA-dihydrouridine synthase family protein [Deinococcus sp. KNUC1210]
MTQGFYAQRLSRPGAVLAPMAGYSDAPMRQLAAEQGARWTVSEMISARGLVLGNEGPDLNLGRPYSGETQRVVQLFGAEADILAEGARRALSWFGAAAIDLNMGCPVPKVRGRGGACLLQTPELACTLIGAMRSAVDVDVSAKIRLGWDSMRAVEVAQGLEAAGAALITVHGRTSAQRYNGEADWDAIAQVAASVKIPVVGSGDVKSLATLRQRQRSGVAAVMVGRGAVGNPWLFAQAAGLRAETDVPGDAERAAAALRHVRLNTEWYGERRGLIQMRKVLPQYFPHHPQWREFLVSLDTLEDVQRTLERLLGSSEIPAVTDTPAPSFATRYDQVRS